MKHLLTFLLGLTIIGGHYLPYLTIYIIMTVLVLLLVSLLLKGDKQVSLEQCTIYVSLLTGRYIPLKVDKWIPSKGVYFGKDIHGKESKFTFDEDHSLYVEI